MLVRVIKGSGVYTVAGAICVTVGLTGSLPPTADPVKSDIILDNLMT